LAGKPLSRALVALAGRGELFDEVDAIERSLERVTSSVVVASVQPDGSRWKWWQGDEVQRHPWDSFIKV